MNKTPLPLLIAVWLFLAFNLNRANAEADTPERPDEAPALSLSPERQRLAGLQTVRLERFELQTEARAYGKVLDIQGLLDLRARYRAALSELAIAEAQLRVAQTSYRRLSDLHRESIIATRDLIQSEAQLASEHARCEGFRRNLREVREMALQTWGSELFRQAVESESALFRGLLDRSRVLILVSLPAGGALSEQYRRIKISPSTDRQQARDAELVSAAPRTDETTQGETWFFTAPSTHLRSGMRLDVWLPRDDSRQSGVAIPQSAVVWHNGRPWVYIKSGEQAFIRRPVGEHQDLGKAWFVAQGFSAGEELVLTGGQMLLSEELRPQIPSEEGDDD